MKLLLVGILPGVLFLWLLIGIPASVIGGAAYGLLQPIFATFEAVGEGKSDPFYHCLVVSAGTWIFNECSLLIRLYFVNVVPLIE